MNTILPLLVCAAAFPAADPAPTHGTVLVLENEQTLTGDIEKVGDQYQIRRLIGETSIPADHVLRLCAGMEDAYEFVRGRANLTDPDERLRLAEWCRLNGLHKEAAAEVRAAVELRPDHAPSRRLLSYLEENPAAKPTSAASGDNAAAQPPSIPIELTEEAMGQFANKVQPILMNVCANCHANGRGGAFRLTRAYDSAVLNRKTMQQNLAAVLGEVNLSEPRNSPLLSKAVSVHGPLDQAPIRNRQAAAYHTLEEWVRTTVADNPQLHEQPPPKPAAPAAFAEARPAATPAELHKPESNPMPPAAPPAPPTPAVQPPPEPADPYSPDAFNRQFHDDQPKPAAKPKP